MAKKKLHSLMDGLIGSTDEQNQTLSQSSADKDANTSAQPTAKMSKGTSDDDIRATFIVPASLVKKIKFIAVLDERLQKDIVAEALSEYVKRWETENGSIPMKK